MPLLWANSRKPFAIKEPSYKLLTLDVLCTLMVNVDLCLRLPSEIKFRVGGQQVNLNMKEFSYAMGVQSYAEMNSPKYDQLVTCEHEFDEDYF